jgi:hypothetical protein
MALVTRASLAVTILRQVLKFEEKLYYIPLVWKVPFEDSEPADLNDRICVIRFVLVTGQIPV